MTDDNALPFASSISDDPAELQAYHKENSSVYIGQAGDFYPTLSTRFYGVADYALPLKIVNDDWEQRDISVREGKKMFIPALTHIKNLRGKVPSDDMMTNIHFGTVAS